MSDNHDVAAKLLTEAGRTILHNRPGVHGSTENSFQMIGELWEVYCRHTRFTRNNNAEILPQDVAQMMTMLKIARSVYGDPTNPDNFVDAIGYQALADMLQLPEAGLPEGKAEEKIEPAETPQKKPAARDATTPIREILNNLGG